MPLKKHECIGYVARPIADPTPTAEDFITFTDFHTSLYYSTPSWTPTEGYSPDTTTIPLLNATIPMPVGRQPSATAVTFIVLYAIVFILAAVGNSLVITTLLVNKRMGTVTNYFLLSLAVSDLLVALVCIPITLTGQILKRYIFGLAMCKIMPYLMGLSVSVSTFTMLAISLERYYAICCPLRARAWQTKSHACKVIFLIWTACLILMAPFAIYSDIYVTPIAKKGICVDVCRMVLPSQTARRAWYLFLLIALFLIPGVMMTVAYGFVCKTIYHGFRFQGGQSQANCHATPSPSRVSSRMYQQSNVKSNNLHGTPSPTAKKAEAKEFIPNRAEPSPEGKVETESQQDAAANTKPRSKPFKSLLHAYRKKKSGGNASQEVGAEDSRTKQTRRQLNEKKKVIEMLIAILLFFFLCATPSYVAYVWRAFDPKNAELKLDKVIGVILLLSYVSTCVNPVVYCFLNKKFRLAFLNIFCFCCKCLPKSWRTTPNDTNPTNTAHRTMMTAYSATSYVQTVKE